MKQTLLGRAIDEIKKGMKFVTGEAAQLQSGAPGYAINAIKKVIKRTGALISLRAGVDPNFGLGINVAAKPMSVKKKSTLFGPARGFLAPGPFDRLGEIKIKKNGKMVYKVGDAQLMNLKIPFRKIIHDTFANPDGQSMYDPSSLRIKEEKGSAFLYFKTNANVLNEIESNGKLKKESKNIEYRINLSNAFEADYSSTTAGGTDSIFRELFDVTTMQHKMCSNEQANLLSVFMADKLAMNSCYEVEYKQAGETFKNLQVFGLPTSKDGELTPITGDLDTFAILMPMEDLMNSDLEHLECTVMQEDAPENALSELILEIQSLKEAPIPKSLEEKTERDQKISQLNRVQALFETHMDHHLTNSKTGFATGYEFTTLSRMVIEAYKELCAEIEPGDDGIIDFTSDEIDTFYETCAAIFQHGPETNNPSPGTLDEDIYWSYNDIDCITKSEDEHIKFLTTSPEPGVPAPCENLIIKINPKWNMEKWKPVYDMMKEAFKHKYEEPVLEEGFASQAVISIDPMRAHMQKFEVIMGPDVVSQQRALEVECLDDTDKITLRR